MCSLSFPFCGAPGFLSHVYFCMLLANVFGGISYLQVAPRIHPWLTCSGRGVQSSTCMEGTSTGDLGANSSADNAGANADDADTRQRMLVQAQRVLVQAQRMLMQAQRMLVQAQRMLMQAQRMLV